MRSACTRSPFRTLFGLAFLSVALPACASEGDALDKRLAKLQEELTRVQSQTDRMAERMDAVELRQATAPKPEERVASAAPTTVSRPKLKVVRVEADGEVANEAVDNAPADDAGPRLVIQGEGKSIESRSVPGSQKATPKPDAKSEPKKSEQPKAAPK
jgi:hypothetical protein